MNNRVVSCSKQGSPALGIEILVPRLKIRLWRYWVILCHVFIDREAIHVLLFSRASV